MKVGIITWYNVINYGAVFQAYALQQSIKKLGHESVILEHDKVIKSPFEKKEIKSLKEALVFFRSITPNRIKNKKRNKLKYNHYQIFLNNHLTIGKKYDVEQKLDAAIIGSDQMFDVRYWCYGFQFGHDIACENINSYAPSFGETTYESLKNSEHLEKVVDGFSKMNKISVRDENSVGILSEIINRDCPMVLDPVLLYDFKEEREKWNQNLIKEPYLLIYSWGGTTVTKEFNIQVKKFAHKNNLKSVSLGDYRGWCDYNYASATPIEFFSLFANTDMVLTNMFHGTCFSLLNQKPFYSLTMPHNVNKLGGLLKQFNLESQILTDLSEISSKKIPKINYKGVNGIIQKYRDTSFNFLKSILKEK